MIADFREHETEGLLRLFAAIAQVRDYEKDYSTYLNVTREFIEEMEASGMRYFVTTAIDGIAGLQATMYKCRSLCLSAPSFN